MSDALSTCMEDLHQLRTVPPRPAVVRSNSLVCSHQSYIVRRPRQRVLCSAHIRSNGLLSSNLTSPLLNLRQMSSLRNRLHSAWSTIFMAALRAKHPQLTWTSHEIMQVHLLLVNLLQVSNRCIRLQAHSSPTQRRPDLSARRVKTTSRASKSVSTTQLGKSFLRH